MSDIFISYARSTAAQAKAVAEALRGLGYRVWLDDELPAHRAYAEVIEERLKAAKAVVVIWSAEAAKSEWVQSEADKAREDRKLVQLTVDGARLPMPFDRIQCADLTGWSGDAEAAGWRKVVASIADLVGAKAAPIEARPALELPNKPSIAVLPFVNRSGDPQQDYFADGMVEEIVAALSRFKSIFVIGAGSGLSFKDKATTPRDAARILGVRYILEGSVRKAGDRVRVAVDLVDASDGAQIWADRFEDTLEDVFALQDKVALSVAGVIAPAIEVAEIRRASARPTQSMGSYDLYLRALAHHRTIAKADILAALDLLKRALALDPDHAMALAVASSCHGFMLLFGWSDDPERDASEAKRLAERALKVAGDDPDVLTYAANTLILVAEDLAVVAPLADRAVVLNPGSAFAWFISGWVRLLSGEPRLALEQWETSLRLDPRSAFRHTVIGSQGVALFAQKRFDEAISRVAESIQLRPGWPLLYAVLAASHAHLGHASAAREAIAEFHARTTVVGEEFVARFYDPKLQELIMTGMALADGKRSGDIGAPS